MLNNSIATFTFTFALLCVVPAIHGDFVVFPVSASDIEGDLNNNYPFNISDPSGTVLQTQRYQQIYEAFEFPQTSIVIDQIAFRPNAFSGQAFESTLANIQVNLSTASADVDSLSLFFETNVGIDDTIVHRGPLSLSSEFVGPRSGPKKFDIIIDLQNPFVFNPLEGNLLMDVRNFEGGLTTSFDAVFDNGDSVSRVGTFINSTVDSPTAEFADTLGLVTRFQYNAQIPEPSALLITGICLLSWFGPCRRNRRQRDVSDSAQQKAG